jgi:hypothetical protein
MLTGLIGLVLLLAWTTTRHVFWYHNENLLLFNPLSLWLAVTVLLSFRGDRFARQAFIVAGVLYVMSVVALVLKIGDIAPQDNFALVLLMLPPMTAIAWGLKRQEMRGGRLETAPPSRLAPPVA